MAEGTGAADVVFSKSKVKSKRQKMADTQLAFVIRHFGGLILVSLMCSTLDNFDLLDTTFRLLLLTFDLT